MPVDASIKRGKSLEEHWLSFGESTICSSLSFKPSREGDFFAFIPLACIYALGFSRRVKVNNHPVSLGTRVLCLHPEPLRTKMLSYFKMKHMLKAPSMLIMEPISSMNLIRSWYLATAHSSQDW